LGKALGSYGAYVCGSKETIELLINVSRSLIFSTAPPPPSVAAASAALELLRSDERLLQALHAAAFALRAGLREEGFAVHEGETHIVPLVVNDERAALDLCEAAIERGVFAQAIRPPTVPPGTSRLRLAAMAAHSPQQMRAAARALREAALQVGLDPARIGEPGHAQAPTSVR
jgi:glycine C-acetyltransferase/8-amino-7-oxononanoate synthase